MSNEKSESMMSKIIVGVSITVVSTIVLVYFGFQSSGSSHTQDENNQIRSSQPDERNNTSEFKPLVFGKYSGSCYNKTAGVGAEVILNIDHKSSGKITGNINIIGGLSGSGKFDGFLEGNELSFTTTESSTEISISWNGVIRGNTISGDYYVSMPTLLKSYGNTDQYGTWRVSK